MDGVSAYHSCVPKLWNETIATHRIAVREAILAATWALVTEHGLLSVTMSRIAEETGIGRATLYKYFPDVEAILIAHHEKRVAGHLERLIELRDQPGEPGERLEAVLIEFARICHYRGRHGSDELVALLHQGEAVSSADRQVRDLIENLLVEARGAGSVRDDISTDELAGYCLHALIAARAMSSEDAVGRLVLVTLDGLSPVLRPAP